MTLREFLKLKKWRQEDAASKFGVARTTVTHLLAGDVRPSLELALRIEAVTDGAVAAASWPKRKASKRRRVAP